MVVVKVRRTGVIQTPLASQDPREKGTGVGAGHSHEPSTCTPTTKPADNSQPERLHKENSEKVVRQALSKHHVKVKTAKRLLDLSRKMLRMVFQRGSYEREDTG